MRLSQRPGLCVYHLCAAAWLAASLAVGGCASLQRPVSRPDSAVTKPPTADELLSRLAQRMDRMQSLRSPYHISYKGQNEKGRFQGAILVHRPDRLRLETLSLVGAILVLTANGDQVAVFLPREKVFSRGKTSKENLLRFTRIPLELGELTSILLGLPPVELQGSWEREGAALERRLPQGGRERIGFDPEYELPLRWDRFSGGGTNELTAFFSDYITTRIGSFPSKISLHYPSQGRSWEIRYREPDVNVEIPPPLFVQQTPRRVREVPLDSFGG